VQDAFWFSLIALLLAFIAIGFIRVRKPASAEPAVEEAASVANV
jgi:hypothetical protein